MTSARALQQIAAENAGCRRCPRLVQWREEVARVKRASFAQDDYWGRPVPGFGDPQARVLLYGLAPAAHGANRTGRVFTGDRSGDFMFASLHRTGFANQPTSLHANDGLALTDMWIAAAVRCAPPANKPTPGERDNCLGWSVREVRELTNLRLIVCLGSFAWDAALRLRDGPRAPGAEAASAIRTRRPRDPGRAAAAARLLPPQPAEHVHRQAHGADDGRRFRARSSAVVV